MATTKERLEQIENTLLILAGGGAGYSIAKRGAVGTAGAIGRTAIRSGLQTPQGRALLAGVSYQRLVEELNERDRELAEAEGTDNIFMEATRRLNPNPIPLMPGLATSIGYKAGKATRKRAKSKFNKAVSAGMKAVRSSKFYGKKGNINNAKRAFSAVTRTASKVNKGKKVSTKGVTGTIARAIRRIL